MKTKTYTIEIASTTYRTYEVNAESPQKAQEIALNEMDADYEIGKAWKQNAEVVFCEPQGGTSSKLQSRFKLGLIPFFPHMSDEEFGKYISGE